MLRRKIDTIFYTQAKTKKITIKNENTKTELHSFIGVYLLLILKLFNFFFFYLLMRLLLWRNEPLQDKYFSWRGQTSCQVNDWCNLHLHHPFLPRHRANFSLRKMSKEYQSNGANYDRWLGGNVEIRLNSHVQSPNFLAPPQFDRQFANRKTNKTPVCSCAPHSFLSSWLWFRAWLNAS